MIALFMITLDNPILCSMLKEPSAPDEVIVDWLQDNNVTKHDMVLLYAGTTPLYQDGIPKSVLSLWLKHQGYVQDSRIIQGHNISTMIGGISNEIKYYYLNYFELSMKDRKSVV